MNILLLQVAKETAESTDWVESGTKIFALLTAVFGIVTFGLGILERRSERKWKQASTAKELVDEIHEHEEAKFAVEMMDWEVIKVKDPQNETELLEVTLASTLSAITKTKKEEKSLEESITLEHFDWFFYFIDRIEQGIQDRFITFDNVKYIFWPYYKKITEHKNLFFQFMEHRNYILAQQFWTRYLHDGVLGAKAKKITKAFPQPKK